MISYELNKEFLKSFILSSSTSASAGSLFHSLIIDGKNDFRQDSVLKNGST